MRQVDAGSGECDTGGRRRERHRRACLHVAAVGDGGTKMPAHELDSALAESIRERVRALVRRALRDREARSCVVGEDGVGLECVKERIEPYRRRHAGWA